MGDKQVVEQSISSGNDSRSNLYSFRLTLISENGVFSELFLPKVVEGIYSFPQETKTTFINISEKDRRWCVNCKPPAYFQNVKIDENFSVLLDCDRMLEIETEYKQYKLFVEKVQPESMLFHNYIFKSNVNLKIGRASSNTIVVGSPNICDHHAEIYRTIDGWVIERSSENSGIYVNGRSIKKTELRLGDIIFIEGLRILVGVSSLSVSPGNYSLYINPDALQEDSSYKKIYHHYYNEEIIDNMDDCFNPAPRKCKKVEDKIITVEGPPMSMSHKQMPLMLRMGSSVVMGGAAALSGNFMTLITSVLFPFLSSKFTDGQRKEYERLRFTKYTEYLENKSQEIEEAINCEQIALNQKYPKLIDSTKQDVLMKHLWERRPCDNDFLQFRLGTGERLLSAKIDYPDKGFVLESDELENKMLELASKQYIVENAPIVISLVDTYICGIQGERANVINLIESMLLQLAIFHSYDEVKMVFLLDEKDLEQLDAIRYIPHVWDDMRSIRFIATNDVEAYSLGEYIKGQIDIDSDRSMDLRQIVKKRPYYVIFALNKRIFDGHEIFKEILSKDFNIGVSVVTAFDSLLKESQKIITLDGSNKNISTTMGVDGGEDEIFAVDEVAIKQKTQALHKISNISLKKITQAQAMPKMVTFLEMFNVGRIEQLNPLKRWRENNPVKSLAAPVGLGEDGTPFMLDLHEKRQGPHGLVAGMTGSGKSEFLITYILSMAVNYHPDEVSFVLIDYKGGGLASAFDNPRTGVRLPHLAGTITNLDGNSIQRSLMSIESELVRRQRVFNEAAKFTDEGTMNISTYQRLYRAGKVDKPMSHLFIISDEFAELKQQQPEFLEKLISAARIGRSLGVHLILATQKPSGVVNDQIRSNTKFQVCLRVQERSDSMDMIKRPDAAELTDTGRFYLQVGYNEYFALGQSAWCGADYEPKETVSIKRDDSIDFIDVTGQISASKKPAVKTVNSGKKQLVAVVEYLCELSKNQGYEAKPLWEPELPLLLDSEKLQEKYSYKNKPMNICIGMVDDPQNQEQYPLNIDFETVGNMLIVGQSGSGKTSIIQNIIYSLSKYLTPNDFNFYGLDYSSRLLKQFKALPHCGDILQEEDAGLLDEFFKLVNKEIYRRKKLFSTLEVDSFTEARKKLRLPLIVVFIDNFIGLNATKSGENHAYLFNQYLKDCAIYGIKYIISCGNLRDVSSKIKQEIDMSICLHMKDKYDYADALGCKVDFCSSDIPGCGICKIDNRPLVVQNAMLCAEYSGTERVAAIKEKIKTIYDSNKGQYVVQRMPVFDESAEYIDFAAQFNLRRIPLGFAKNSGKSVALPLKQYNTLALYFGNNQGIKPILNNFLYSFQRENVEMWIIKRKKDSLFDVNNPNGIDVSNLKNADFLECEQENLRILQQAIVNVTKMRTEKSEPAEDVESNSEIPEVMLLIESAEDFSSELNSISYLSYKKLFETAHKYGIYVLCCFEPQSLTNIPKISLQAIFSSGDILLLGGQYDKQKLYNFGNVSGVDLVLRYNLGFMVYRNEIHPMVMPCGNIIEEEKDIDLESIF